MRFEFQFFQIRQPCFNGLLSSISGRVPICLALNVGYSNQKIAKIRSSTSTHIPAIGARIELYSQVSLETVPRGLNAIYNSCRQRVLDELSPEVVLRQRLEAYPALANPTSRPLLLSLTKHALHTVADAKVAPHPDTFEAH